MKKIFSLTIAALLAIGATAQEPLMPRRCIHSIDQSLIQPVATPAGMQRAMSTSTTDGLGSYGKSANGAVKSIGAPKIPVIMVEFSDLKFHEGTTQEKVTRLFNENGYNDDDNINMRGSIRDYFIDNSNGLFAPDFEVVGKVTAANKVEDYGANSGNDHNVKIKDLVKEAVALAQAAGIDFTPYVDGTAVPMVILYYAGMGENNCFDSDKAKYIWPHFSNHSFTQGNVKFNSYYVGNEWRKFYSRDQQGNVVVTGERIDGIGVLIHELGHALGLPDMYPTNGGYYNTPDWWSVMDYGEYYANGYRPVGMTAYERSYLGWLDVKELNGEQAVALGAGEAALVRNPANSNEYYLLENRQDGTWYPSNNYGTGLLVMHVDYLSNAWTGNTLNNTEDHLRCHVLCADGKWTGVAQQSDFSWDNLKTDLFGYGDSPVTTISDWKNYTGDMSALPVFDIEQIENDLGGTDMRFSYISQGLATVIPQLHFTTGADAYTLDGRRVANPANGIFIINGQKVVIK